MLHASLQSKPPWCTTGQSDDHFFCNHCSECFFVCFSFLVYFFLIFWLLYFIWGWSPQCYGSMVSSQGPSLSSDLLFSWRTVWVPTPLWAPQPTLAPAHTCTPTHTPSCATQPYPGYFGHVNLSRGGGEGDKYRVCVCVWWGAGAGLNLLTLRNVCPKWVRGTSSSTLVLPLRPMPLGWW